MLETSARPTQSLRATTWAVLALAILVAIALRVAVLGVGAPFITIDDRTAFEGGFLVWFGHAPPQRMYLESWIYGAICLLVYAVKVLLSLAPPADALNVVTAAYRDFYNHPEAYVLAYRCSMLALDVGTTLAAYRVAVHVLGSAWNGFAALTVAVLFLFSYNTLWCSVVARPDTVVAFFATAGVWAYLSSGRGDHTWRFVAASVLLGLAAGMKLHGAFMTIFLCIDLLRVHGIRVGLRRAVLLATMSGSVFAAAAGSVLFDPVLYVKLRHANYQDDISPWLHWGDQFVTLLRGAAWLAAPLAVAAAALFVRDPRSRSPAATIAITALLWIALFCSIRQLRAYWMLPALPLIYASAVLALTRVPKRVMGAAAAAVLAAVVCLQTLDEVRGLRGAPYTQVTNWLRAKAVDRPFYVFGYDALILPRNTVAISRLSESIERSLEADRTARIPFVARHLKNWEERSQLRLFDMLDFRNEPGFEFYDYYAAPPSRIGGIIDLNEMAFVLVQEHFDVSLIPAALRDSLNTRYRLVAELTGAGGGRDGLRYKIYERTQ